MRLDGSASSGSLSCRSKKDVCVLDCSAQHNFNYMFNISCSLMHSDDRKEEEEEEEEEEEVLCK